MKQMKNKLKIGGDAYTIEFCENPGPDPNVNAAECWNMDAEIIEVKNSYGLKCTLRTILHGVIHAVLESRGHYLKNNNDEVLVDGLAMGLGDAMLQNPNFFRELLDTYT